MDDPFELAASVGPDLVVTAGLLVAMIFALRLRPRLGPRVSMLAAIGLALLALGNLLNAAMVAVGYRLIFDIFDTSPSMLISGYSVMSRMIWVTGIALLIAAIFIRRPAA